MVNTLKNKWIVLVASVVMQAILGGIYAWSNFVPRLEDGYALSKSQLGLVFGLSIATFTVVMILAGRWLAAKGPRLPALTGALLFAAGYLVAAFSQGVLAWLIVGISLLVGAGIGLGYVTSLSVSMRWFPNSKGIVTGVAVGGFGAGAIALVSVSEYLFASQIDVLTVFKYIGLIAGAHLVVAALLLTDPPNTQRHGAPSAQWLGYLKKPQFMLLFVGLFAGSFAGLMVVSHLQPMAIEAGLEAQVAPLAVSLFAVGNATGRVAWGLGFQKMQYRSLPASLVLNAVVLLLPLFLAPAWMFLLASALIGFGYGAAFVVYASATTKFFGIELFSTLYPIVFLAYGLAALAGPWLAGFLRQATGSYKTPIVVSLLLTILAAIIFYTSIKRFKKQS